MTNRTVSLCLVLWLTVGGLAVCEGKAHGNAPQDSDRNDLRSAEGDSPIFAPRKSGPSPGSLPAGAKQRVTLFAAASTTNALDEIKRQFRQRTGVNVQCSYAASSTLAQQITSGAAADVFVSANVKWAEYLDENGLVAKRLDLLENRMVVILPADSRISVHKVADLLSADVRHVALADTTSVPAGVYAKAALSQLGLWKRLEPKVVAAADVRQALFYVETGAAEAGIVYATDAAITPAVQVAVNIPPELTAPIRYPIVLLKKEAHNPAAVSLFRFLQSPEAAAIFQRYGFTVPSAASASTAPSASRAIPPPAPAAGPHRCTCRWLTRDEWTALWLSFQVAVCAALAGLPFAVALGYLLARVSFSGKWLVETAIHLPLVLPPVVTGYLLLVCFSPRGPVGSVLADWFGVKIVFTWLGAVLASAVVSFPLSVRAIRLAFQGVDPRLETAARSLGASRLTAFFTISLPLARRGLVAGWLLAFARSLGEFGATIMVAGNIQGQTRTIPLEIFSLTSRPGGIEQSWRLVGLSILLACGALAISELLERRQSQHESA